VSSAHVFPAWLDLPDGRILPVAGACGIGRSSSNAVHLESLDASRRHALIQAQNAAEFWLVDLGSSNGTYLNGRRLVQPRPLAEGDRITVAGSDLVFHVRLDALAEAQSSSDREATLQAASTRTAWLLLGDIEGSTPLSQRLPGDELASLLGKWIGSCKEVVEQHGGAINKYLGDGFLAYWWDHADAPAQVAATLAALRPQQLLKEPPFRLIVHHGEVIRGFGATQGEECLLGPTVNFIFRVEKVAGRLRQSRVLSHAASVAMGGALATVPLPGEHEVKDFSGHHRLFVVPE
jgi:class 3 adenylate cyclase